MLEERLQPCDNDEETEICGKSPGLSVSNSRASSEEGEIEESKENIDITTKQDEFSNEKQEESRENSAPPLPSEPLPGTAQEIDDGWAPIWEETAQGFYFFNRFTGASQWTNPRVPEVSVSAASLGPPGVAPTSLASSIESPPASIKPGYNPAIHGDYDSNAWYAQPDPADLSLEYSIKKSDSTINYTATAAFNRFTGRFQNSEITPENFSDENKSKRQMNAYFDVDAAANSHDGRSLKAERSGKKLSKTELKQFKEKRKMKKEERRRAWLRD